MPSKKKPRPQFEVPLDIETAKESGWVYRSNGATKSRPVENLRGDCSESLAIDAGSSMLALGIAAIAEMLMLGLTIAAIPMTIGLRSLKSLSGQD